MSTRILQIIPSNHKMYPQWRWKGVVFTSRFPIVGWALVEDSTLTTSGEPLRYIEAIEVGGEGFTSLCGETRNFCGLSRTRGHRITLWAREIIAKLKERIQKNG